MRILHSLTQTLLLALLMLLPPALLLAADELQTKPNTGFQILDSKTSLAQGYYHLDADIALRFSDESLKALDSGVPITLQIDVEVLRLREYLWDENIHEVELRYQLRYHQLTKLHVITDLLTGQHDSYRSRHAAINALGSLHNISILEASLLDPEQHYRGRIRCGIDIEALPAPLRIPAYLSQQWRLQSDWYSWPL